MRALAGLSGVSRNQAALVLRDLDRLGLVERRTVGRALVVTPVEESPVVSALRQILQIRETTLMLWREAARRIEPPPAAMSVYGSWARGEASSESDVDLLVVRPPGDGEQMVDDMNAALANWVEYAERVCGLPISLLVVDGSELTDATGALWEAIRRDGVPVLGDLWEVGGAA
jgi:predicted nucleotidyltransferase